MHSASDQNESIIDVSLSRMELIIFEIDVL